MQSGHKVSDIEELAPLGPRSEALEDLLEGGLELLAPRAAPVVSGASTWRLFWAPVAALLVASTAAVGTGVLLSRRGEAPAGQLAVPVTPEVISEEAEGLEGILEPSPPAQPPASPALTVLPPQVMLRSLHGHFVAAERDGTLVADRPWADDWEKFAVVNLGEGAVALKSFHGSFVRVDPGTGGLAATAPSGDSPGAAFEATFADDGGLRLKSSSGKFVSTGVDGALRGNASKPSQGAEFEVFDVAATWPEHVAVKSSYGKYLRGEAGGAVAVDGQWPLDDQKRLRVTRHSDGMISLQFDHGEYLSVRPGGTLRSSMELSNSERFIVTHLDDGKFTMQDHKGRYVWAGQDGVLKLESGGSSGETSEKLEVVFLP